MKREMMEWTFLVAILLTLLWVTGCSCSFHFSTGGTSKESEAEMEEGELRDYVGEGTET